MAELLLLAAAIAIPLAVGAVLGYTEKPQRCGALAAGAVFLVAAIVSGA